MKTITSDYQKILERHSAYPDSFQIEDNRRIIKCIPAESTYNGTGLTVYYSVEYDGNKNRQQHYGAFEQAFNCATVHPTWQSTIQNTPLMSHKTALGVPKSSVYV